MQVPGNSWGQWAVHRRVSRRLFVRSLTRLSSDGKTRSFHQIRVGFVGRVRFWGMTYRARYPVKRASA